ncbi:rhodanese-like domain-containing protein [Mucilaginibacter ginsenosidivorans]|uniref:Rhodanese-like domain-containing protein n=1 Tax=Mucilaginibacter ginsenosidivorans TaxID=398053 RepID=A0A5B8UV26_9SPHI|nr:rhodanese-like domain-containing protein [Mucilaginibacter ginsenosidivorans]QEC62990.1 rhodanese-like domain-containing protein [Mucilaginibacter ginsenosidivorans]
MKPRYLALLLFSLAGLTAGAQQLQLYDNTNYKAIYFKQACDLISKTPNLVLLDVRSPGEYADTSQYVGSRIGRLKGSVNISIDSVEKHFNDLKALKGRPFLVYCSHSQRSRRVSKFLADSGFTNIYSLNGGMTEVNRTPDAAFPCKSSLYTSNLPYKLIPPDDAVAFVKDKTNLVIDVRPAAQFNGTDSAEFNNIGRFKNATNIPHDQLDQQIGKLAKYKERPILVVDLSLTAEVNAAEKLTKAGFKNVSVLYDGIDAFILRFPSASRERKELLTGEPGYKLVGVKETVDLLNNSPNTVVADIRPKDQFENKAEQKFLNLGRIKNAVNLVSQEQLEGYLANKAKTTPVLIYGSFSAGTRGMKGMPVASPSELAKKLAAEGYTHVYLLYNGIYDVVWSAANVDGLQSAKGILTDHEGLY